MWWTLHRGEPVDTHVLTAWERYYADSLRVPVRRHDFVHGRWVAKHLIAAHLQEAFEQTVSVDSIEIERDPDGVPRAAVRVPWLVNPAFSVSISHRRDAVLAASMPGQAVGLGADVEVIEPRSRALVEDFFVADEVADVDAARDPDLVANTIWSAKEAVLKALHLGLSVDTRRVCCRVPEAGELWREVDIECELEGVGHPRCWCLRRDDLVLTLAVAAPVRPELVEHVIAPPPTLVVRTAGEVYA